MLFLIPLHGGWGCIARRYILEYGHITKQINESLHTHKETHEQNSFIHNLYHYSRELVVWIYRISMQHSATRIRQVF